MRNQTKQSRRQALTVVPLLACSMTLAACSSDKNTAVESPQEENKGHLKDFAKTTEENSFAQQADGTDPNQSGSGAPNGAPGSYDELVEPPPVEERYPYGKPKYPTEGRTHSREGALAVAKYYTELIGYSFSTLDTKPLEELCDRETARQCRGIINLILDKKKHGAWMFRVDTRKNEVSRVEKPETGMPGEILVLHTVKDVRYASYDMRNGPNIEIKVHDSLIASAYLEWKDNRWVLADGRYLTLTRTQ
ncbi:DUF6318 family protein [Gleimia hominis]|uniref:DUF6318 family protein n=1 Tax=Gleimia hominis TaxID=595468 RepID=A0ABU3I9H8_9ACTO|nr:DUF6318 family protein [Gleimia hominis]MDT3767026.1 DUF6318 family protein [Gleimia hominis]